MTQACWMPFSSIEKVLGRERGLLRRSLFFIRWTRAMLHPNTIESSLFVGLCVACVPQSNLNFSWSMGTMGDGPQLDRAMPNFLFKIGTCFLLMPNMSAMFWSVCLFSLCSPQSCVKCPASMCMAGVVLDAAAMGWRVMPILHLRYDILLLLTPNMPAIR